LVVDHAAGSTTRQASTARARSMCWPVTTRPSSSSQQTLSGQRRRSQHEV
jgi:hypothetical protein